MSTISGEHSTFRHMGRRLVEGREWRRLNIPWRTCRLWQNTKIIIITRLLQAMLRTFSFWLHVLAFLGFLFSPRQRYRLNYYHFTGIVLLTTITKTTCMKITNKQYLLNDQTLKPQLQELCFNMKNCCSLCEISDTAWISENCTCRPRRTIQCRGKKKLRWTMQAERMETRSLNVARREK